MSYNEGVNPDIISENNLDINNAKAGTDLFQHTDTKKYELDSSKLFTGGYQIQENDQKNEDLNLFESQIEFENTSTNIANNSDTLNMSYIVIVFSVAMIITYIYYIVQKMNIEKELTSVNKDIKSI